MRGTGRNAWKGEGLTLQIVKQFKYVLRALPVVSLNLTPTETEYDLSSVGLEASRINCN